VRSQHVAPRCTLRNSHPRLLSAAAVADSDAPEVGAAGTASAMSVLVFVLAAVAVTSVVDRGYRDSV